MNKTFNLYNGGEVEQLVNELANKAKAKGLTLSRWQANKSGHAVTVTYALHTGERAAQFRYQPEEGIVDYVKLDNLEGSTKKCEAYREISELARSI